MSGFTLTETLIVLALAVIFVNLGIGGGIAGFEQGLSRTDRIVVVNSLREARAEAMSEISSGSSTGTVSHGVYVSSSGVTLFEGSSYATRTGEEDQYIPFFVSEAVSGSEEIVFQGLSGNSVNASVSITGTDHIKETATVSAEGEIVSQTL